MANTTTRFCPSTLCTAAGMGAGEVRAGVGGSWAGAQVSKVNAVVSMCSCEYVSGGCGGYIAGGWG